MIKDYSANKSHIKKVFEIPGKWILSNIQAVIVHTEPYDSNIEKNFETILCLYDQFEFQKSKGDFYLNRTLLTLI